MRLLEHEAKQLLSEIGIPIPREAVVTTPNEAAAFARALNAPVVVKAQIPIGGRAKMGGVLFASSPEAVARAAQKLLGATIRGYVVERISAQERIEERGKFYLAATLDSRERRAVLLASAEGGVDIEESRRVLRQTFSLRQPYPLFRARELAAQLGAHTGAPLHPLTDIIHKLARFFQQSDALLIEVNPLLLTNPQSPNPNSNLWIAVDAHIELDDDALFRHNDLASRFALAHRGERPRTSLEQRAAEIDGADHRGVAGRVVEFDGDLALLIGGGGASLTVFDAILAAGGKPANYCEIGGNPSVWKTAELTKLLLSKPGVKRLAVIMNVVNNTRADLMARGVIKGIVESGREPREVIAAFRIPGSWEEESVKILRKYGVRYFGRETSLNDVAEYVVKRET
jgi:succinyl-CoA synthetase beta subunit/citryl-CoA synthetase large subunit